MTSRGDTLRDCRKSQIMAILAISHVMKSIAYKHQIHRFRVFRQSLRISLKQDTCDMPEYHNIFMALKTFDKLEKSVILNGQITFTMNEPLHPCLTVRNRSSQPTSWILSTQGCNRGIHSRWRYRFWIHTGQWLLIFQSKLSALSTLITSAPLAQENFAFAISAISPEV